MLGTTAPADPRSDTAMSFVRVLGMRVDGTSYGDATDRIARWARARRPASVAIASVNNVMSARDDPDFGIVMDRMDLTTPDGMPLVWALRLLGSGSATRVSGSVLMEHVLARAEADDLPVGFHGGAPEVLDVLVSKVRARHPAIEIAYAVSPPFRPVSEREHEATVERLAASGTRILFVGLGCPKQEHWQIGVRDRLPIVTIGVGAAFDFLAGRQRRAPRVLQQMGLEWAYRLAAEPRRLWRRYLRQNPRFLAGFVAQLVARRFAGGADGSTTRREGHLT